MRLAPQPLSVRPQAEGLEITLAVPASLACFAHHFPAFPMLPGVLQLDWAIRLAREHLGIGAVFREVTHFKFQHPILPEAELTLRLNAIDAQTVAFSYSTPRRQCSSGRVVFAAVAA